MANWVSALGKASIGLALCVSSGAGAAAWPTDDPLRKVESRVMIATAGGQPSSFVVLLAEQCDMGVAYTIADPDARGWYVYRALRRHARRTQRQLRAALHASGIHYRAFWAANALVVNGDRVLVEQLAARADVQAIESNLPSAWIEDPSVSDYSAALETASVPEWGVSNVNAPSVWSMGFTGQGIVIGNQDTGIQWDHPALRPQYRGWNGSSADHNYNWHDGIHSGGGICGASSLVPCDDSGHGTHTTGTAAGFDGANNQIGVAPGARWIGCRNMDRGVGAPATYMECFQFFMAPTDLTGSNPDPTKRPHVMNNSWGCPPSEGCAATTLKTVVENAEAAGIFVEVSAGNSGPSCSTVQDPPAIYAVAFSSGAYDSSNTLAGFSSRGPVLVDGSNRMKPNIAAPGVNVRSSLPTNFYGNLSGTSMAGPHVVGVVALLWSARPQLVRDVATTKSILQMTANPSVLLSAQTCGGISSSVIPNNSFGYGRVDALAAVNAVPLFTPTATASATRTLSASPTTTATFTRTETATSTRTGTATDTPTAPPSNTPSITATPSETPTPSQTPSPTLTPSITQTPSPTPSVASVISGRISYYSADRPVANTVVRLAGHTMTMTSTTATGSYQAEPVPFGNWTVTPEQTGSFDSGITAVDASYALQAAVGTRSLDPMQLLAADANASGTMTAIDASLILQLRVGLITRLPVAAVCNSDWAFVPQAPGQQQIYPSASSTSCQHGAIAYSALQMDIAGQNFLGILYGDVNGSWDPSTGGGGGSAAEAPRTPLALRWGSMQPRAGRLRQPLYLDGMEPVYAFDAELRYDTARFRPIAVRRIGAHHTMVAFNTAEAGRVRLAVASAEPITAGVRPVLAVVFERVE